MFSEQHVTYQMSMHDPEKAWKYPYIRTNISRETNNIAHIPNPILSKSVNQRSCFGTFVNKKDYIKLGKTYEKCFDVSKNFA